MSEDHGIAEKYVDALREIERLKAEAVKYKALWEKAQREIASLLNGEREF